MPPHPLLAKCGPSIASEMPPASRIFAAGILCLVVGYWLPQPQIWLGFMICGGVLCALAWAKAMSEVWEKQNAKWQRRCAEHLISHDQGAGFVADQSGRISFANRAARKLFAVDTGDKLDSVFGQMLASPTGIVLQLIQSARQSGASAEDIVTCTGHYRMRVLVLGADCQVWWFDDLNAVAQARRGRTENAGLPMLTVTPTGRIIKTNAAFQQLVRSEPRTVSDVFEDVPLRNGHVHALHGSDGRQAFIIAETAGSADTREIYLLPGAEWVQSPPALEAEWDAIEELPVPLLKIANDGQILGSNRQARQLLNCESTMGRMLADVLDGPGRPINDWLVQAVKGHIGHASEFLRGRGDNRDTFVQVTLSRAGDGAGTHLIVVMNDVTELKTLEAQFVQSQKMQAIGQLAGGVAHDFNNLLTAISGHCDLLLLRHDEGDQNYGDLIQIHQNANRAASLVGQLLAFSRKQNLQLETIDLRDTLSDLTHLLNRLVGEKVTLTLDHDPALRVIRADKRQLEQVLMNLVVNARDAMAGAGEIRVVTQNLTLEHEMRKDRAVVPPGDYVAVNVIDEGKGIAPDKLHKIFEPFYTTKKTGEGTGLGLSTAYGIVKQTGGYIFAESKVDRGTTFSLLFPHFEEDAVTPVKRVAPAVAQLSTKSDGVVLLVEDEAPVRAFASRALSLKGYTVLEADCAEAALELLRDPELNVDVFVSDVIMPGLDGPTWVREALKSRPATKVVFVSGYPEDAFDDGEIPIADAVFLPKPFSLKDLTHTVHRQLSKELEQA